MNDKENFFEKIVHNIIGDEVHIFNSPDGEEVRVKKFHMADFLPTGNEYCPDCHIPLTHNDGYWECDECGYSITDDESENGDGYPTLESTFEDDYDEYYSDENDD